MESLYVVPPAKWLPFVYSRDIFMVNFLFFFWFLDFTNLRSVLDYQLGFTFDIARCIHKFHANSFFSRSSRAVLAQFSLEGMSFQSTLTLKNITISHLESCLFSSLLIKVFFFSGFIALLVIKLKNKEQNHII